MNGQSDFPLGFGFIGTLVAVVVGGVIGGADVAVPAGLAGSVGLWIVARAQRPPKTPRRWLRGTSDPFLATPQELLERRLALGEITVEEFFEREAVLRNTDSPLTRQRTPRH